MEWYAAIVGWVCSVALQITAPATPYIAHIQQTAHYTKQHITLNSTQILDYQDEQHNITVVYWIVDKLELTVHSTPNTSEQPEILLC